MRRAAAAACLLAAFGCAASHRPAGALPGEGPLIGVYRASIGDETGTVRHVKLLLWAGRPDRLHAELLSPVGGVRFVLDAGAGSACVVDLERATAYAGDAGPRAVEGLVGLSLSIEDAVGALLSGTTPAGLTVERSGGAEGELPEHFVIADGRRSLALRRVRLERGGASSAGLGTGQAPPGMSRRPLEDLPAAAGSVGSEDGGGR